MSRQRGFALLELMIAMCLATLLAIFAAGTVANRLDDALAQSTASWMLAVNDAVRGYLLRYGNELVQAPGVGALAGQGYADWSAPTLAEFKADRLLSSGFPESGGRGLAVRIRVLRDNECPGSACVLQGLVYSSAPLARRVGAEVNEQMVAQWLLATQGKGGAVTRRQPEKILGAGFSFRNPPVDGEPMLPIGTVALAVTAEQLDALNYLRVGDTRDPLFQGTATIRENIQAQASLTVEGHVLIGAQEFSGTACAVNGQVAREYYGGLLVCRSNRWVSAGGQGGGGYSTSTVHGCTISTLNPVTGDCSCPPHYDKVRISESGSDTAPEGRVRGYLCVG